MNEPEGMRTIDAGTAPREIFVNDAGKSILQGPNRLDSENAYDGGNTGRTDEIRAGIIAARVTATKKWLPCKRAKAAASALAATALTVGYAGAFKAGDDVAIKGNLDAIKITDSDNAASTGVALYLHMDELGENNFGHLEAVTAGNADGTFTTVSGSVVKVEDDDSAASGGFAVYFDEDAAEGAKLLAAVPTGKDAFIFDTAGRAIRIKYAASPSGSGVQLYFDDDGAAGSRVLFVSPTNASGFVLTDSIVGVQSPITKATGINVDSIDYGTNTLTLASAQTWAEGDQVYVSNLAGAEIPRAIVTEGVRLLSGVPFETQLLDKAVVLANAGFVDSAQIIGDYEACRESSDSCLGGFQWLDKQRP